MDKSDTCSNITAKEKVIEDREEKKIAIGNLYLQEQYTLKK